MAGLLLAAPAVAPAGQPRVAEAEAGNRPASELIRTEMIWQPTEGAYERTMLGTLAHASTTLNAARRDAGDGPLEFRTFDSVLPAPGEPWGDAPRAWRATAYEPATGRMHALEFDADGAVVSSRLLEVQPRPTDREWEKVLARLAGDPQYGPLLAGGVYMPKPIMPPVDDTPGASRMIHVALAPLDGSRPFEVIGYDVRADAFVTFEGGAPDGAFAPQHGLEGLDPQARIAGICGLSPNTSCPSNTAGTGILSVSWPTHDPIWSFDVVRPSRTDDTPGTPDGTGVELRNVRYRGELVFLVANMPVLNVLYDGNICGPYRDWLDQETCFKVTSPELTLAPGFHDSSASKPFTICDDSDDSGNFRGVAVAATSSYVRVVSEMSAGQYRYINSWTLDREGSISPVFQVLSTRTSCTCVNRTHHGYWRFDVALGGKEEAGAPGGWSAPVVVERKNSGGTWEKITVEQTMYRDLGGGHVEFRIRNPETGVAYQFQHGPTDGTAVDDTYGRLDTAVLAWKADELADAHAGSGVSGSTTYINLADYVNGESVDGQRLAFWYGVHQRVTVVGGEGDTLCDPMGPTLRRVEGVFDAPPTPTGLLVGRPLR